MRWRLGRQAKPYRKVATFQPNDVTPEFPPKIDKKTGRCMRLEFLPPSTIPESSLLPPLWSARFPHYAVEVATSNPFKPIVFGSVSDAPWLVQFAFRAIGSVQFRPMAELTICWQPPDLAKFSPSNRSLLTETVSAGLGTRLEYCRCLRMLPHPGRREVCFRLGRTKLDPCSQPPPPCPRHATYYSEVLKRGSSGCVRPMVSHQTKPKTGAKERKAKSVNRRIEQ